jgi:hypothetical protein
VVGLIVICEHVRPSVGFTGPAALSSSATRRGHAHLYQQSQQRLSSCPLQSQTVHQSSDVTMQTPSTRPAHDDRGNNSGGRGAGRGSGNVSDSHLQCWTSQPQLRCRAPISATFGQPFDCACL